jgi:predicted PurR-regulated permease PerM
VIPYLGPWLGALPPFIYALVVHPISALWVALLFLGIQQIEGHVVVPKVMGNALRLHPLLVIFGLAAGAELYGLPGALTALPLLAVGRAIWEFFADRLTLEPWQGTPVPVEVELVDVDPPRTLRP